MVNYVPRAANLERIEQVVWGEARHFVMVVMSTVVLLLCSFVGSSGWHACAEWTLNIDKEVLHSDINVVTTNIIA